MKPVRITSSGVMLTLGLVGAGLIAWWVWKKGGIGKALGAAGAAAGGAAVNAVTGVVTGAADAASDAIGIPGPSDTTTDPAVARWIIDQYGYLTATLWAGVPALLSAMRLPTGSGRPPAPGTPAYAALPKARIIEASEGGGIVGFY